MYSKLDLKLIFVRSISYFTDQSLIHAVSSKICALLPVFQRSMLMFVNPITFRIAMKI